MTRTNAGYANRLVIMVKEPKAGGVKTRLARDLGAGRTVGFYRALTTSTVRRLGADPRWQTILAVSPDTAVVSPVWPHGALIMAQGRGDLGVRMNRIMQGLPPGPVIIIGSDIPDIAAADIAGAFAKLGPSDAVFGPSPDGGYWLVGLKRCPSVPSIFGNVRWSSPTTLDDTLANLGGASVAYVGERDDIDTIDDYRIWQKTR